MQLDPDLLLDYQAVGLERVYPILEQSSHVTKPRREDKQKHGSKEKAKKMTKQEKQNRTLISPYFVAQLAAAKK